MRFAAGSVALLALSLALSSGACVPPGNAPPFDGGAPVTPAATTTSASKKSTSSAPPLTSVFEDNFDRQPVASPAPALSASTASIVATNADAQVAKDGAVASDAGAAPAASSSASAAATPPVSVNDNGGLGPDWIVVAGAGPSPWHLEQGRLCGRNARNRGVWLNRTLPVNARIEFDAETDAAEGDLKAEVWGDGQTGATGISYTNATSYLVIFGGWKNTLHVLARLNEHGTDRKVIEIKPTTDEFRERAVAPGTVYHFKVERSDGKSVRWWVNDTEMLTYEDPNPLVGTSHDHFGFNDWQVRVCFDNVKVTPLSAL